MICIQLFDYALGKHNERNCEVTTFYECINEAKEDNRKMGITNIDEFMEYKAVVDMTSYSTSESVDTVTRSLNAIFN